MLDTERSEAEISREGVAVSFPVIQRSVAVPDPFLIGEGISASRIVSRFQKDLDAVTP